MCAHFDGPGLLTERLLLRPPTLDDAGRIAELADDYAVARNLLVLPHPYGREDAEGWILSLEARRDRVRSFVIEHPVEGLVGVIGFRKDDEPFAEVGYWIGQPYWGRGYATEALRGALRWARDSCGARAIAASHFTDNPASGWVLVKAGFLHTGRTKVLTSAARNEPVKTRMMIWLA